jgi:uncharacterized protein YndB with AHSA1/START domain
MEKPMSQAVAQVSKTIVAPSDEVWRALTTPKTLILDLFRASPTPLEGHGAVGGQH